MKIFQTDYETWVAPNEEELREAFAMEYGVDLDEENVDEIPIESLRGRMILEDVSDQSGHKIDMYAYVLGIQLIWDGQCRMVCTSEA
jgi:hypothetical protein